MKEQQATIEEQRHELDALKTKLVAMASMQKRLSRIESALARRR